MSRFCAEFDITSNARIKNYPSLSTIQVANFSIFREPGTKSTRRPYSVPSKGNATDPERSIHASMSRARSAVRDIVLCNSFTHFFTWTLDPTVINRYDVFEVKRRVGDFLKNAVRRKCFSYVCIPEFHKDGAIHFHGLCTLGDFRIARAHNIHTNKPLSTEYGQPIFNMLDWSFGHSTCIPLNGNIERTGNYVCKYITKDSNKIFGKWYWSSRGLIKKPETRLLDAIPYNSFVEDNPSAHIVPLFSDVKMCCLSIPLGG